MSALRWRQVRWRVWVEWFFLCALLGALGATVAWQLFNDYRRIDQLERERVAMQAQIVERNLTPELFSANRALDILLDDLKAERPGAPAQRIMSRHYLQTMSDMLTGVRTLMVIGPDGVVVASNKAELVGQGLGQRPYFLRAQRERLANTLYITPPFVTVLNTFVVNLVRVRLSASGEFQGIVVATLDTDQMATLLDSVRYAPDTCSSMLHGGGAVFLRLPTGDSPCGSAWDADSSFFAQHQQSGQTQSVFSAAAAGHGIELLVALRSIRPAALQMDHPLVVAVARPVQTVFAPWRADAWRASVLFGLLLLGSTLSLTLYQRRQRRFEQRAEQQEAQRLTAYQALRQSEKRFQALTLLSSDWFWQQDADYRFVEFTGATVKRALPIGDALGKTRWELNIPLTEQQWAEHRAVLDQRLAFRDFRYATSDDRGATVWCSINGEPLFDDAQNFIGYHGTGRDITAEMLAEQELRIAAAAFESQEGMLVTDAYNQILRVNQAFCAITGYSSEEIVGQTPRVLRSGRHDRKFYEALWMSLIRDGSWQGEIWNKRKNGDIFPVWQTITAVRSDQGKVTHYVATQVDITQRLATQAEIENLAFYDPLTKLPNRRLLTDRMHQAAALSRRTRRQAALLFIDLDNFKTLNDTRGHTVGDLLLQQVAERLSAAVREGDTVARLGGDEFIVMLENLSVSTSGATVQAEAVAQKIHSALNQPFQLHEQLHRSTPSIGITLFDPQLDNLDELLTQADLAMYQAKKSGRNTVRFFNPEMQRSIAARVALEDDLRAGLSLDQFVLHYQPQVNAQGSITGVEALLRWQHPTRGMVPPMEFIPLAEDTDLILPIGQWVLQTACEQLQQWAQTPGTASWTLSVNISARQLQQANFVADVVDTLAVTGANAQRLKLEITESLLFNDVEDIIAKMLALKAHGIGFSLDDFGTGYSSLSYLKRLPLYQLKIDRSFVRDVLTDTNDLAIVRTIVALAETMGLGVIAEGVETEAQRQALAAHGCHACQGYLFGKPVLASELGMG